MPREVQTYISTQNLVDLGARWNSAAPGDAHALKKWALVGFRLRNGKYDHDYYDNNCRDETALTKSFQFCADQGIPIAADAEGHMINAAAPYGGRDFLAPNPEKFDAVILSWVWRPETPAIGHKARALVESDERWKDRGSAIWGEWSSPHYQKKRGWQNALDRSGAKMAFILGDTYTELSQKDFRYFGSPFRSLEKIKVRGMPWISGHRPARPSLAVITHKDYDCPAVQPRSLLERMQRFVF